MNFPRIAPTLAGALAAAALMAAGASPAPALAQSEPNFAALHDALHLTSDQEEAWRDFVASSQPSADDEARERSAQQMMPSLRAPQRVDLTVAAMQAQLETMRARGAALKAFYARLTPAQQLIFDRQTAQRPAEDE
ncbi:MAG TPA: Spy/CpxP family protein refolding chaperone [Caulobacteraceae bacterium]|jgi:hypothetical protein